MQRVPAILAVTEQVVHQQHDADTVSVGGTPFSRQLISDEQPYVRRTKATESWRPLDTGWLGSAGLLCLENLEGRFTQVVPTDAERQEAALRVVEIGLGEPPVAFARVRPGESCRFEPIGLVALSLRCRHGAAKIVLSLIPE